MKSQQQQICIHLCLFIIAMTSSSISNGDVMKPLKEFQSLLNQCLKKNAARSSTWDSIADRFDFRSEWSEKCRNEVANDLNNETDKAYYENMLVDQAFRSQTDELKVALKLESSHYNAQRFGQTVSLIKGGLNSKTEPSTKDRSPTIKTLDGYATQRSRKN